MDMPYAKTSVRAEQRTLREKMRALGLSRRQVAVEFARKALNTDVRPTFYEVEEAVENLPAAA